MFEEGDSVQLIRPHVYRGQEYHYEAQVGYTGIIVNYFDGRDGHEDYVRVKWDDRGNTSMVNVSCLTLVSPIIYEQEDPACLGDMLNT